MLFGSMARLHRLKKNQYLKPHQLKAFQEKKLREVIQHACKHVAYYKNLFRQAGIKPDDINTIDDLSKIPVTTKKDLQKLSPEEIVSSQADIQQCVTKYTSGSTGNPLKIFLSPEERDFMILLNLRILVENGLKLTDKLAYIINPHRFPKSKYWFQHLGILRREYLSVFDNPQKHTELLKKMNPDIIYSYPSNLSLLALYMKEKGIDGIRPKTIFSIAEALEPNARKMINSIMDIDTCDILGTIELGDIAWQCVERKGYHLSSDAVIIEFLNNGKPVQSGEEGKIVCTSLYQHTMPFIRYAVNDICVPSDKMCSCGRSLPMIESIKGRANDFVVLPDGQIMASCFLVITMQEFHDIAQYRIIQENKNGLNLQLVKGKGFKSTTPEKIKNEIQRITNNALNVNIEMLDKIKRDQSGKLRTVISKIIPDMQEQFDQQDSLWIA